MKCPVCRFPGVAQDGWRSFEFGLVFGRGCCDCWWARTPLTLRCTCPRAALTIAGLPSTGSSPNSSSELDYPLLVAPCQPVPAYFYVLAEEHFVVRLNRCGMFEDEGDCC
jgi:hypothetical protein